MTAGGNSAAPLITPDGRYVAFASTANNLALTSNQTTFSAQFRPCFNVYLRDRTNGTTRLVSVSVDGSALANADSIPTGISSNGQFIMFESFAGNLVTNQTTGKGDIYMRDVFNGLTFLVSANTNGQGANSISQDSVMTPDGRFVAFSSPASDLVPNDTNGIFDIFIRDTVGLATQLVSVGANKSPALGTASASKNPLLTPDGRYVVFYSTATNLLPGVPAVGDLFMRDTLSNTTTWVSAGAQGLFYHVSSPLNTNSISFNPVISDDGLYVAYEACAVSFDSPAYGFILRYDTQTGLTDIISSNAYVQPFFLLEDMNSVCMTPDGRFVAYVGNSGVVHSSSSPYTNAVFLWDAQSRTNALVSINLTNGVTGGTESDYPAISSNGQFVAFISSDTNITTNTFSGSYHLFRRDMLAGVTQLVDVDTNGAGAGVSSDAAAVMSADGSLVAYQTGTNSIVTNDRNRGSDIFIHNFTTQATELISPRDPTLPSAAPDGSSGLYVYCVNTNGRYVAFTSEADDNTPNDTNGFWDVFVRDFLNTTNTLVSVSTNGLTGNGASFEPSISGDGRYVAFTSFASNLVAGDANASKDVFLRDLQTGATTLVSVGLNGLNFGSSNSWQPTISADGRFVLFHSIATNLAAGTIGAGLENVFLRDLHSNATYALAAVPSTPGITSAAMTPDGRYIALAGRRSSSSTISSVFVWNTQATSLIYSNLAVSNSSVSISPNGQKIAWWNSNLNVMDLSLNTNWNISTGSFGLNCGMQFSAAGNLLTYAMGASYAYNVYLFNFLTGSNILISHGVNSTSPATGSSDSPAISGDGRFVVYRSSATNLVTGVTNGQPNLFLFDNTTGMNSLLSQNNLLAGPADARSLKPVFSGDGRSIVFQSWSSDMTSFGDFNANADLFAYAFPYLQITQQVSTLQGPTLFWPAVPGQSYQVEYSTNFALGQWQTLAGTPLITGNQASLSDATPVSGQRFYRLLIY